MPNLSMEIQIPGLDQLVAAINRFAEALAHEQGRLHAMATPVEQQVMHSILAAAQPPAQAIVQTQAPLQVPAAFTQQTGSQGYGAQVSQPLPVQAAPVGYPPAAQAPATPAGIPPAGAVPTAAPTYQIQDLMRAGSEIASISPANREKVLGAIHAFGAQTVNQIPTEHYAAYAAKLRELGAKI